MSDAYSMVLFNGIAFFIVLCGIFFYTYIYPKKNLHPLVILIICSLLPLLSLFRPGDYESGDFNIHIYRIISFYHSLQEGNIMPSWAAELNATYGNTTFLFNYSLPYYLICFFHFLGLTFINATKLYLGLTLFFSGITMYVFMLRLTKNALAATSSGIFYVFSPYHLIDVHFRATLGESTIFMIAPLLFYFILMYHEKKNLLHFINIAFVAALCVMGHPLLAAVIFSMNIWFLLFLSNSLDKKSYRLIFIVCAALLLGCISMMYVWGSFFLYAPYTFKIPIPKVIFYDFSYILYSPWRLGMLFQGPKGEIASTIGYPQMAVIAFSLLLLIKKMVPQDLKKGYFSWIILCFIFLFFLHPISSFLWRYIPSIANMFTPYARLMLAVSFCTSVITGYLVITLQKRKISINYIYILLFIGISCTILNWGHRRVIPAISDEQLEKSVWHSTLTEGTTAYFLNNKWADKDNFWFASLPTTHLRVIKGHAQIKEVTRTSTTHTYVLYASTPVTIQESTLFFPGWKLISNNKAIPMYPGTRGIITANLPKGLQYISVAYTDIWQYRFLKIISLILLFGAISIYLYYIFTSNFLFFLTHPKHFSRKS